MSEHAFLEKQRGLIGLPKSFWQRATPAPGKTMTPTCSPSSEASLRLNPCGTLRLADGQPVVVRAK
jgi:hypothetical protein